MQDQTLPTEPTADASSAVMPDATLDVAASAPLGDSTTPVVESPVEPAVEEAPMAIPTTINDPSKLQEAAEALATPEADELKEEQAETEAAAEALPTGEAADQPMPVAEETTSDASAASPENTAL